MTLQIQVLSFAAATEKSRVFLNWICYQIVRRKICWVMKQTVLGKYVPVKCKNYCRYLSQLTQHILTQHLFFISNNNLYQRVQMCTSWQKLIWLHVLYSFIIRPLFKFQDPEQKHRTSEMENWSLVWVVLFHKMGL